MRKRWIALILACVLTGLFCCACGSETEGEGGSHIAEDAGESAASEKVSLPASLASEGSMELTRADQFCVDFYEGGYALITVANEGSYLLVPEAAVVPEDLGEEITVLSQPLGDIYLVASAVMDMYVRLDALDDIRFSALDAGSWYIDEAREKMEAGDILYAGKYSAPDYELILSEGCSLAIENTMIYHSPEVKEELESRGIPVVVDRSSYESDPLGRMEWIKLYGLLCGKEELADEVFDAQAELYEAAGSKGKTGKTVAFFYITSTGAVNVRKTTDYLPRMIEQAGGSYIFDNLGGEEGNASSSVNMQMEEFYEEARDADYLIYNSTVEGEVGSMRDFLSLSPLLENFRAVSEDHVYCTKKDLYQASMELGTITSDISKMLTDNAGDLTYLYQVTDEGQ